MQPRSENKKKSLPGLSVHHTLVLLLRLRRDQRPQRVDSECSPKLDIDEHEDYEHDNEDSSPRLPLQQSDPACYAQGSFYEEKNPKPNKQRMKKARHRMMQILEI